MPENEKAPTPDAKPAAPASPVAKPAAAAAAKPPAPAKGEASPHAKRPTTVIADVAALAVSDVVVPFLHTVRAGETLASIAKDYYGDRSKAGKIRAANPSLAAAAEPAPGDKVKVPKE